MILLTVDEIIMLHGKLLAATGGLSGLRDRGLLESAVFSVEASFQDVEQYPTIEGKAARLAYALISNHAFVDGNVRTGVMMFTIAKSQGERIFAKCSLSCLPYYKYGFSFSNSA